ncbi:MAG TPA: bifunctional riboflavin kinase/FAD synthetase [Acidimicrobiia bacterium]|nr:bifunctional riboflavin kinase/FAD synthetase [Acidimicrobiia bacterium]
MERIREGGPIPPLPRGAVVTIGTFDGVHRGHQAVLDEVRRQAAELDVPAVAVTFDRHPASVVRPESAPRLLTSLSQKLELLASSGIDYTNVLRFDEERSLEPPEQFIDEIVVGTWHARVAVEGADFHFGHRRRGDLTLLEDAGARWGFKVDTVPLVQEDSGAIVSSDAVRSALARADVVTAASLLGRLFELQGVVEHGDNRGRTIGFPTANVAVAGDLQLPADGVYAGWYERPDGTVHASAINIGRRPTFYAENGLLLVEAHLLDFDGDLYDEHARVRVETWLRGETRFGSVDDLKAQLTRDVEKTRQLLGR